MKLVLGRRRLQKGGGTGGGGGGGSGLSTAGSGKGTQSPASSCAAARFEVAATLGGRYSLLYTYTYFVYVMPSSENL
jgi:hypothetical protein